MDFLSGYSKGQCVIKLTTLWLLVALPTDLRKAEHHLNQSLCVSRRQTRPFLGRSIEQIPNSKQSLQNPEWWWCFSCQVMHVQLLKPHGLLPIRLLGPWDFPGRNTGVGCHSLLQGIFPTPGLLHYRWILYLLSHQGHPVLLEGAFKISVFTPPTISHTWEIYLYKATVFLLLKCCFLFFCHYNIQLRLY